MIDKRDPTGYDEYAREQARKARVAKRRLRKLGDERKTGNKRKGR